MRVSIEALFLGALLGVGVVANPCAAEGPAGVRVATATPAASPAPKFTFILFWKQNNATTQEMTEALKQAVAKRSQRAECISVNITDGAQRAIVDRYHVERAPMPMVLCIAPNGAITGGITRQLTEEAVDKALVTPRMTEATKALQDKRIAVIHVKRDPKLALPAGAAGFVADPAFKDRSIVINVSLEDAAEARFVKEMEFKPDELSDSMIVVLAPPGVLVGKYQGSVSTEQIATDLHAAGKCCNDPNCKHNKKGAVAMTPRKLVWKELWQRPTAMATCLLAIMLGVTALVAIRSVTVYSEKTVAKQMSELGANILLLPKNASLQDYYAADANGETIPEEYGSQLLLADLPGVEHIAPKLSMQTECNGHTVTLTGILPQSEFDAQAEWKGVQAFNKSCGKCSKRVVLDEGNHSAAEGLAKGRFVSEIAKDEVIVGADAAQQIGATAGAKISLLGKSFRVGGVMPATGTLDDGRVFAHLHTVQPLAKAGENVNVIEIMACCEDAAGGLVGKLREYFPNAKVLTITQVVDTQVAVNRLMTRLSYLFFAILLVVGVASIAGTMFANVSERRREIGTLMALGATPSLVARLFLSKALLIGLVGGVLGYVIGTALAVCLGPSWAGVAVRPVLSLAGISILLAASVALVSSYLPARRASLIDPCLCFREV